MEIYRTVAQNINDMLLQNSLNISDIYQKKYVDLCAVTTVSNTEESMRFLKLRKQEISTISRYNEWVNLTPFKSLCQCPVKA